MIRKGLVAVVIPLLALGLPALLQGTQQPDNYAGLIRARYTRQDVQIPMRDGVKLYTVIYAPKDATQKYPILMNRTPYSVRPYDKADFRSLLGPNQHFAQEGYIFVFQDVRGCYLSEGTFEDVRPHNPNRTKKDDIDESTDTYDTIDWLIKNVAGHNGKAGLYGISYPGFYTAAGMIDAHPNLIAASPQAPIADWFFDDFHHHGTTYLAHAFRFISAFGQPRPQPTTESKQGVRFPTPDGYQFFLDLGSLKNVNERYFKHNIAFWDRLVQHPNYDEFWKARNLLPNLKKVAPHVMTVGGWYDAEDLYGTFKTYQHVEKQNPGVNNSIVVGPWVHGGWSRTGRSKVGNIDFGSDTSSFYQKTIELAFFNHHLKGKANPRLPEAYMFETGTNLWRQFDHWPPQALKKAKLYPGAQGKLAFNQAMAAKGDFDEFLSDPSRPVPYTEDIVPTMTNAHMTDDQRYASRRPDVLVYQTEPLKADLTLAGPLQCDLRVSTSAGDADWIVKLIDVFPNDAKDTAGLDRGKRMAGYQMLVRHEAMRGRFRNSYERPEPFQANEPTRVPLEMQDVLHTFKKGHRIMIQVSSTWFPLVDRNPQKYVANIFEAGDNDFIRATHRLYRGGDQVTSIEVGIVPQKQ